MVTRKKKKAVVKCIEKSCVCGECEEPHPHIRGYLLMALGLTFLPISSGFFPELDWVAHGWPVLLVMFGIVLVAKAAICQRM